MRFIDMFAGVGGFRRGLEQSGHECAGFIEWDKFARLSYISMHTATPEQREHLKSLDLKQRQKEIINNEKEYLNGEWSETDICNVRGGDIPTADLWTFGAPCQDFSIAGKRMGMQGNRSSLIREVFRLLEEKEENKPEWIIYENVKGMLSSNRGFDFFGIILELERLGYDVEWQIINSKWFIPQNRERVYVVGHYRGRGGHHVLPIQGATGKNSIIQIGAHAKDCNSQRNRVYSLGGVAPTLGTCQGGGLQPLLVDIEKGNNLKTTTIARTINARYDNGVGKRKGEKSGVLIPILNADKIKTRQNGRRIKTDEEPMFTLTAQDRHGVVIGGVMLNQSERFQRGICKGNARTLRAAQIQGAAFKDCQKAGVATIHTEEYGNVAIRKLTPKECFRLQGWSDEYFERAKLVNSNSQLWKQAGNGVTVNVVKAIGDKLWAN